MKDQILENYKKNKKTYHDFRERVINLLTDLLAVQEINIHNIGGRTKTIDSLSKKIDDKGEKYSTIGDITDIIGIRIITYMESDVDSIAELIEKEFIKDIENSIDKRKLKTDQFGYRSLHIVASLNEDRCGLKEYKKYKGIKCEIQVRSILQHAWAEIEHDLGYKGEVSIPDQYKRTFNRLSALLETADVEFDRLKSQLNSYEKEIPELIENKPESVDINRASIISFLKSNPILLNARSIIERKTSISEIEDFNDTIFVGLRELNFKFIGDLENALSKNEKQYLKFVDLFVEEMSYNDKPVLAHVALLYFLHFTAIQLQNIEKFTRYGQVLKFRNWTVEYDFYNKLYNSSLNT
jgi:ppGpp synthetase/RelA/SpoT-type nucleotidyltranferase